MVKAVWNGKIIAQSDDTVVVEGNHYFPLERALLHKSAADLTSPFPGQIYPATSVMGVPSAVKPLSTATRTWNSAT